MRRSNQKEEQEIKVLKEVVDRNKLRNSGDSIDKMVELLQKNNIEIDYAG